MIDPVLSLLREHDRFVLTTHVRPDGDALGSQLAFGRFLKKLGKQVTMLNSDPPPRSLEWLPDVDDVEVFEEGSYEHLRKIAEAEVIFVLDTNSAERIGQLADPVRKSGAVKVLIDHHREPERWFDVICLRDTAAATGELIYEIIDAEASDLIDAEMATTLYTAIMTDTGSFRYSSVTPHIHRIVADLLERGDIQPAPIHASLYDNQTFASLRLLGRALDEIRLRYDGQVGYTVVTNDMLKATGADSDDKKGLVSYVLSIEGVKAALIFTEARGGTKVSFRSQSDIHVDEWARAFGGGGHRNASGAYLEGLSLDEAIEAVLDAAPRYIDLAPTNSDDTLSEEDASYLNAMLDMKSQKPSSS